MQSNSSKKTSKHPNKQSKLFEESSTPMTKATLQRKKKKAPPEDTAFVNN